jgi:drug/metabolite transporter (DMT)-like permease
MRLYGALVGLSLIWGMSFLFIKVLNGYVSAWEIVFLRCLFGALPLYAILLWKRVDLIKLPWFPLLVVGMINAAVPWTLIAISETVIQSSTASILNATTPIWTSLVGFTLFSVRLSIKQWTGIVIGFFGILVLMNFNVADVFGEQFVGIGTMVAAAFCYGFASQYTKRYLSEVSVLVIAAGTLTVGMIVTGLLTLVMDGFSTKVFSAWEPITSAVGLGVFGSGLAYLLFFYMVQKGSAEFATYVTYLVPVTAMFWGWSILGEPLSTHLIIGLLFIFGGVYLSGKRPTNRKAAQEKERVAAMK